MRTRTSKVGLNPSGEEFCCVAKTDLILITTRTPVTSSGAFSVGWVWTWTFFAEDPGLLASLLACHLRPGCNNRDGGLRNKLNALTVFVSENDIRVYQKCSLML